VVVRSFDLNSETSPSRATAGLSQRALAEQRAAEQTASEEQLRGEAAAVHEALEAELAAVRASEADARAALASLRETGDAGDVARRELDETSCATSEASTA
jgi:hypothetical protein